MKSESFANNSSIAVLIIVVLLGLALAFPKNELLNELYQQESTDGVSILYLESLVQNYPNNVEYRLLLAKQFMQTDQLKKVTDLLEPILKKATQNPQYWYARFLSFSVQEEKYHSFEQSPKEKAALIQDLTALKKGDFYAKLSLKLAYSAYALGDEALVNNYLQHSYETKQELSLNEISRAAKLALWVREYELSSEFYFFAQTQSLAMADKLMYFQRATNALMQSGDSHQALEIAREKLHALKNDKQALEILVRMALMANEPKVAEFYVNQIIKK